MADFCRLHPVHPPCSILPESAGPEERPLTVVSAAPVLGVGSRPTCSVCGRSYKSLIYLRRHQQVHQGATRCQRCGQVYSSISNLQQHMRNVHSLPLPEGVTPRSRRKLERQRLMQQVYRDQAVAAPAEGGADGGERPAADAGTGERAGAARGDRSAGGPPPDSGDGGEEWPEASQQQWLSHFVGKP